MSRRGFHIYSIDLTHVLIMTYEMIKQISSNALLAAGYSTNINDIDFKI